MLVMKKELYQIKETRSYKMKEHVNRYKYIYLISMMGFFITGILQYPNPIDFDSHHVFDKNVLGNIAPASWMGWFYPYLWKILYKATNTINSMGIFINLCYWISLPIIYINLFKNKNNTIKENRKYNFWYLIFILYPFAIKLVSPISNNVFVVSFLLLSMASYAVYNTYKNKGFLIISLILLVVVSLIRRDAFIFIAPLVIFFSVILANYNKIVTGLILGLLVLTYMGTNYLAIKDNPNYYEQQSEQITIDTLGLISLYDLTIMSFHKNELLLPDSILKEEFRNENRAKALQKISSIYNMVAIANWSIFEKEIPSLLLSETVWHSGLTLKQVIPIYIKNIPQYIQLKLKIFYKYLVFIWVTLFISLIGVILLFIKPCSLAFSQEQKHFCLTAIGASWISIGAIILAVMSVQYRYIMSSSILMWIISIYIFYTIISNYNIKVVFDKIED